MTVIINQTVVGNIGRVYEKHTAGKNNNSVIEFSVCATRRAYNPETNDWQDKQPYWITCTAWGRLADNIEQSFRSGDKIFVHGRIEMSDPYEGKDGIIRETRAKLVAEAAGLEISSYPAVSRRVQNSLAKKEEDEFSLDDLENEE